MENDNLKKEKVTSLLVKKKISGFLVGVAFGSFLCWVISYQFDVIPEQFRKYVTFFMSASLMFYWIINSTLNKELKSYNLYKVTTPKQNESERFPELIKMENRLGERLE